MKQFDEIIEIIKKTFTMTEFAYNDFDYPYQFVDKCKERFELLKKDLDKLDEDELFEYKELKEALLKDNLRDQYLESLGLGPIIEIEQGGGEGKGDYWYSVKHLPKHNLYIRIEGQYTSYDGTDFDDYGVEVKPKQKLITVYESIT